MEDLDKYPTLKLYKMAKRVKKDTPYLNEGGSKELYIQIITENQDVSEESEQAEPILDNDLTKKKTLELYKLAKELKPDTPYTNKGGNKQMYIDILLEEQAKEQVEEQPQLPIFQDDPDIIDSGDYDPELTDLMKQYILTPNDMLKLEIEDYVGEEQYTVRIQIEDRDDFYYTINANNIADFIFLLKEITEDEIIDYGNYNQLINVSVNMITGVYVFVSNKRSNWSGKLFKYLFKGKTTLDLKLFQIFRTLTEARKVKYMDHCFIHSLKVYSKEVLKKDINVNLFNLFPDFKSYSLNKRNISKIANFLHITVKLALYNDDGIQYKTVSYNKQNDTDVYKLVLFRGHYMANIKDIMKHMRQWFKDGDMKFCAELTFLTNPKKMEDFYLNNYKRECIIIDNTNKKPDNEKNTKYIVFADFETIELKKNKKTNNSTLKPFLFGYTINKICDGVISKITNEPVIISKKGFQSFDEYLNACLGSIYKKLKGNTKECIIYFHNLKFDYNLFKKMEKLIVQKEIIKDGQVYAIEARYYGIKINFRDSYKLISKPLSSFKSMFNLESGKIEFELYDFFNRHNYDENYYLINEVEDYFKSHNLDYNKFSETYKDYYKNDGDFEIINMKAIYLNYLKYDVLTLADGMIKFDQMIKEVSNKIFKEISGKDDKFSIFNHLTISSLSNKLMEQNGAFDGIACFRGEAREFIQKTIIGGRVCLKNNQKQLIETKISDFDGVSLYPSAIYISKIPMGMPEKIIGNVDLSSYGYYVVKLDFEVLEETDYDIPMYSEFKDNKRNWFNPKVGEKYTNYFNKDGLEDLCESYNVNIIGIHIGLYWSSDCEFNTKMSDIIKMLFEERLKQKAARNPIQEVYKLIMNSAYGKTALKPSEKEISIITKKYKETDEAYKIRIDKYISTNIDNITYYTKYNEKCYKFVKRSMCFQHRNLNLVASIILSKSKIIMNRILRIAHNESIPIYYTDTDSIHMRYDDIGRLSDQFRNQYNEELIGKNLCQFHNDFDGGEYSEIFIGLAKKVYIDKLDTGKLHMKCKGMPLNVMKKYLEDNNINAIDFYRGLYDDSDKFYKIDLTKGKLCLDIKDSVVKKSQFIRKFGPFK